jgi:adenine-specific DNA-methyltransferase
MANNNKYLIEYILALLNSKLYDFIFRHINSNTHVSSNELNSLPIPEISQKEQISYLNIVNSILLITQSCDYIQNNQKKLKVQEYESFIDSLVYQLFNLSNGEIDVVKNFN